MTLSRFAARLTPGTAVPKPVSEAKQSRRRAKWRGTHHEYAVAEKLGGRRTSRSGAGPDEKGDVKVEDLPTPLFVEVKYIGERVGRGESSITFDRDWMEKTLLDAQAAGELPVVALKFPDGTGFYVTNQATFETLIHQLRLYYDRALGAGDERLRLKLERIRSILLEVD